MDKGKAALLFSAVKSVEWVCVNILRSAIKYERMSLERERCAGPAGYTLKLLYEKVSNLE